MQGVKVEEDRASLQGLTVPVAVAVAAVAGLAWFVTWATSDFASALMMAPTALSEFPAVVLFFAILVVMMVAMMLPAALPMILTFQGLTRLEAGRPMKPADRFATALFIAPYFLVWGGFSLLALLGIGALGVMGAMSGPLVFLPAAVLVAAGVYQVTRTKAVCLTHCQSPAGFVMLHWRSGRAGAFRMGLRHAAYCIGCCWLFMLVLFVTGSMSLVWMGGLSLAIFAEKAGPRTVAIPRAIGAIMVVLGAALAVRALLGM
jgi:predicted metal-binding membrane protein